MAQSKSGNNPRYDDPYFQDYEENEMQVQLHSEKVESFFIDNSVPIDPRNWKRDPNAWKMLKDVFLEMYVGTQVFLLTCQ